MNAYKYQVQFSKRFVTGLMAGMTIHGEMVRFATWDAADEFARKCDGKTIRKPCIGSGTFISESPILEAI